MLDLDVSPEVEALLSDFDRDGYVVIRGAISRTEAQRYRDHIVGLLPPDLSLPLRWKSSYGRIKPLREDGSQTFDQPELLSSWQNERLYEMAARVLRSERLRVFDGSLAITVRHDPGERSLWHDEAPIQPRVHIDTIIPRALDRFQFNAAQGEVGGCYYLTDVVPGGGGIRVLPGGHRWVSEQAMAAPDGRHLHNNWTDITGSPELVEVTGSAGDFVMLHHLTPHAVSHNRAAATRVVQFLRWVRVDHAYGSELLRDPAVYDSAQRDVLTTLGRRLLGIDPWPDATR